VELTRTRRLAPSLRVLDEATSTNDVLAGLVLEGDEPHGSTVITLNQTAGRGRLGRVWVAPPGKTLAASVLLRPSLADGRPPEPQTQGWLPLIAGAAMSFSVDALVGGGRTGLKWPNDVQVDGLKVCGVLAELLPSGGVIVGTGVNLSLSSAELPVPTATSLSLAGVTDPDDDLVDRVLAGYLENLNELLGRFLAAEADAGASGIHRTVSECCRTLGKHVRVTLPGGSDLFGVAIGIDPAGCLQVRAEGGDSVTAVAAGDVTHLRYE
jgi:BirA family biotin operon repressor/biotin-[acetyl-CoA-carboxylase] ligase